MIPAIVGFDWDGGNREKCRKHGVSIAGIEQFKRNRMDALSSQDRIHERYSQRRADAGSIRNARRAGIKIATIVAAAKIPRAIK